MERKEDTESGLEKKGNDTGKQKRNMEEIRDVGDEEEENSTRQQERGENNEKKRKCRWFGTERKSCKKNRTNETKREVRGKRHAVGNNGQ